MTIIFLAKIRFLGSLQKYLKSRTILCFLPKRMQRTALVGKTNEMYNLLLGELTPRNKLVAGTLEILADGTANLDRWRGTLLGELPPSTRRAVREIVALGVLATLEARMGFERGENVKSDTLLRAALNV
jgi:hypothetical protein